MLTYAVNIARIMYHQTTTSYSNLITKLFAFFIFRPLTIMPISTNDVVTWDAPIHVFDCNYTANTVYTHITKKNASHTL